MSEFNPIDQKLFERIEAYLDGRMDSDEELAFEVKMKGDKELMSEVELQRTMRDSIDVGSLKTELDDIHGRLFSETTEQSESSSGLGAWKIAAGVALVLGIAALLFSGQSKGEELFAEYVTTDPGLPVTMGVSDSYAFQDAMVDYKEAKYEEAYLKWKQLKDKEGASDTLDYYLGSSRFNQSAYAESIPYFERVIDVSNSAFHDRAMWYACLAFLKTNKYEDLMQLAPREDSKYLERILEIKQSLNE